LRGCRASCLKRRCGPISYNREALPLWLQVG
jgi:hypothetical protein